MAQEAIVLAAPRAEEMTSVVAGGVGAGITGVVEGVAVMLAPRMGAAAPIITWGTLLGAPLMGTFGALFTRGMIGDLFKGVANAGVGILAYSVPALISGAERRLTAEQRAALAAGRDVKLLSAGSAAQRAQEAAARAAGVKSSLEF
ncbi:hypothetical protein ES703_08347 [subsurface metagenome]